MSASSDERRYSEEEFALILRIASEPGTGAGPAVRREGLTLSEIRSIAAEAGIDPDRVSRAAAYLPSFTENTVSRLLGGATRHRLEHSIPGTVPPGELGRVIDVVRKDLATQGESREVMGGLEWKGRTSTTNVVVSITPRNGDTVLQLSADRSEMLVGIYGGIGFPVAGVIALSLAKLVFGESDAGIVAALLSCFAPSLLIARAFWKRSTRKWRDRLLTLLGDMTLEAEATESRGRVEGDLSASEPGGPAPGAVPMAD